MIFVVYCDDLDSSSGVSFSGIFDNIADAQKWAASEGPNYKILPTQFGPIDWQKFSPLPSWSWE